MGLLRTIRVKRDVNKNKKRLLHFLRLGVPTQAAESKVFSTKNCRRKKSIETLENHSETVIAEETQFEPQSESKTLAQIGNFRLSDFGPTD